MAHFRGVTDLRRQFIAETRLGALQRYAPAKFLILGLIHHSHATLGQLTHNAEAIFEQIARLKLGLALWQLDDRVEQKPLHALFPPDVAQGLLEIAGIPLALLFEKLLPFVFGLPERFFYQLHDALIIKRFPEA
jgi:hypothetical protein